MANKSITIKLTFSEDDLNAMLDYANFDSDVKSLTVADLTRDQFEALKTELQESANSFVEEIVEGSRDACANDWLSEFAPDE